MNLAESDYLPLHPHRLWRHYSIFLFPFSHPFALRKGPKSFPVFLRPLTEGAEDRVRRRRWPARSSGTSGKTRRALGRGGRLRPQRFAPALCPLSATQGSGSSGGGRRRQLRRRRPTLERRLKKELNRRGVRPLVVGGLPTFGAARPGETVARGSRWGPDTDLGGASGALLPRSLGRVRACILLTWTRKRPCRRLRSSGPFFVWAREWRRGRTGSDAARSPSPSGAQGLRVLWVGPEHGEPYTETHLLSPRPSVCLFVPFSPRSYFDLELFCQAHHPLPFPSQSLTMPPARPHHLSAPPPSSPPSTLPSSPYYPHPHCAVPISICILKKLPFLINWD